MIRIVWGSGHAPTGLAAFDAALADAGVHQYNLRSLSSVIPADVDIEKAGTAPDLGPTGEAVDAVIARQSSAPGARAAAGLAWTHGEDGTGIFYEAGNHDPETVERQLRTGMEHGCAIRDIETADIQTRVVTAAPTDEDYSAAVCLAVYGESTPLL